ncbi:MAG: hypothetical protein ACLRX4_07905 [Oscillospiraceae bacterium]
MNRELTLREKVLLLILIVLVMVLGYFKLLYEPVSDRIARCREDTAQEQLALEQNAVRLAQMERWSRRSRISAPPAAARRSRASTTARRCCASCAACSRARGILPRFRRRHDAAGLYRPAPRLHDLPHEHLRAVARDH